MPALSSTARNGLATWFGTALGYPVFWANQDMPRPAKPFGQLFVTAGDMSDGVQAGNDEKVIGTGANVGTAKIRSFRKHMVSLQVFTDDTVGSSRADLLLGAALEKLNRVADRAALVAAGVRVQTVGSVRDLTALLPTRAESRAQADLTVSTLDLLTETTGYVAEVVADLTVVPNVKRTIDQT